MLLCVLNVDGVVSFQRNMAMQVQADRAFFHNSRFYGDSSDTLFTGNTDNRAYFSSCYINGSYDFLWGVGSAVFVDSTIVGSDNIAAHKGSLVDRNGVLGGCTGDQLLGHSCTAYLMLNCRLPRPTGYRGRSTTLGRSVENKIIYIYRNTSGYRVATSSRGNNTKIIIIILR